MDTSRIGEAAGHFRRFMEALGFDPEGDEHLAGTPERVAKMYWEMFHPAPFTAIQFAAPSQNMVTVKDIPYVTLCAHHWLPVMGTVSVGYIPRKQIVGLSKLPRAVGLLTARPSIQELMTEEIRKAIAELTTTPDVAVVVKGRHLCMEIRGVKSTGEMITSAVSGAFRDNPDTRAEFLSFVGH